MQNDPIALIVDTSSSATHCWDETRRTAEQIYLLLAGSQQCKLYKLGSSTEILSGTFKQIHPPGYTQQAQACSLIAPIMEVLVKQEQKHLLIIVGCGEIFDLLDWTDDPRVGGWLLIRTNDQSLQAASGGITEITQDEIRDKETLLSYFTPFAQEPDEYTRPRQVERAYRWSVDSSGYPLIHVEALNSFVHLFPVTKPQFEKFIVSDKQQRFGDEWYEEIIKMSPRVSYCSQDITLHEQLFMTGVTTDEAASFSKWLGREYKLLSHEEWTTCYDWFAVQMALAMPEELNDRLARDAKAVWKIIESQYRRQHTLRELSQMTQGILEWVEERPGSYYGLGEPSSSKYMRKACDPVRPLDQRRGNLGFRLIRRSD
jgi:hypothetical protein